MVCLGFVVAVPLKGLPILCLRLRLYIPMDDIATFLSLQPGRHVVQVVIISKLEICPTKSCSAEPACPVSIPTPRPDDPNGCWIRE